MGCPWGHWLEGSASPSSVYEPGEICWSHMMGKLRGNPYPMKHDMTCSGPYPVIRIKAGHTGAVKSPCNSSQCNLNLKIKSLGCQMEDKNLFCHMGKMPSTLPNRKLVLAQATLRSGYKPDCKLWFADRKTSRESHMLSPSCSQLFS